MLDLNQLVQCLEYNKHTTVTLFIPLLSVIAQIKILNDDIFMSIDLKQDSFVYYYILRFHGT